MSKVNPHANITKIDCVQKCNLYSLAKEAEHVTLECIIHYLAFQLLFSVNIKLSVIYVLLATREANQESTPTSYLQEIFGPGHRAYPAIGLLLQTSLCKLTELCICWLSGLTKWPVSQALCLK